MLSTAPTSSEQLSSIKHSAPLRGMREKAVLRPRRPGAKDAGPAGAQRPASVCPATLLQSDHYLERDQATFGRQGAEGRGLKWVSLAGAAYLLSGHQKVMLRREAGKVTLEDKGVGPA